MREISIALKSHLAGETTTVCTCWKVTRSDATVFAFTDHDRDLVIDGVTYLAASGYTASNVVTAAALNVDNLTLEGMLSDDSITADDLRAGLWDRAAIVIFLTNWADLTQGALIQRTGHLGEVTVNRGSFTAELRGLTQAYSRVFGEKTTPGCRADLGDARCQVDLAPFTKTGTITSVSTDEVTLGDTSRTEPGQSGGVEITGITNANPGVVTMANGSLALVNGQAVTISYVLGMTNINGNHTANSPSGSTFQLSIDTSDTGVYSPYTSGGTVTLTGGGSGYFDFGLITFTSGDNTGFSMEIKSYDVGMFTLQLPMPYAVQIGDTYIAVAGCDKALTTCRDRFDNVVNMRAEPWSAGLDAVVQVGRQP